MIIDISPTISEKLAVWPGDIPFTRSEMCSLAKGDNIDLSSMNTTLHLGAHVDAPSHYKKDAASIDQLELDAYLGPCQVIRLDPKKDRLIQPEEFISKVAERRVLFHTGSFPDPNDFNEDFRSFAPESIEALAQKNVLLIGIDTPSFDLFESKTLCSHNKLYEHNIKNIEGLVLDGVSEGRYELIALPLKIKDADASPVRAILRSYDEV